MATILIVDDTPANLRLLANLLGDMNYRVRPAPNGQLALRSAMTSPPDLILLDINMPGMNGYDVCLELKKDARTQDIPIIFISALDAVNDKVKAFQVGGVDYITKPFQVDEVMARVRTHLALHTLQHQLAETNARLFQANSELEKRVEERTQELSLLNEAYARFLPREFLGFLERESAIAIQLGDQVQKSMTVLFSDIRDFTMMSENMTPQENFNFLNAYLQTVSPLIRENRGFIDKYLGDGVMALFPEEPDDAIQAAIGMQKQVRHYNDLYKGVFPAIRIGTGVHMGSLMLGIIGEEQRMQGTVISDAVNLAARIEELTGRYGVGILVSEPCLASLKDVGRYHTRSLGRVQVKGKQEQVPVVEIFDGDSEEMIAHKEGTKEIFEQGVTYFHQRSWSLAQAQFTAVVINHPSDYAAQFYLQQIDEALVRSSY